MDIFGLTDTGVVRRVNQDAFSHGIINDNISWAAVCDGMGGANGGDYASRTAVEVMKGVIADGITESADAEYIKDILCDAINAANDSVYNASKEDMNLFGMGTTVVAAVLKGSMLVLAHAGDSRAYVLSENGMRQVTVDHSLVQEMVDRGEITEEEARTHPRKNVITRALGVADTIEIDFSVHTLEENEAVLLCTDGLTNFLEDKDILELFCNTEPETLPQKLIDEANENGGGDNITAVIMYQVQKKGGLGRGQVYGQIHRQAP